MKMRVRGYSEHKLKDPYKFWSKLLDTPPRRKKKSLAQYTYVSRIDDHTLRFTYGPPEKEAEEQLLLCTLSSNDTWTILVNPKGLYPRHSTRIQAIIGSWPAWNKKEFSMYENACRLYFGNWNSVPYELGVQVYRGKIVDQAKYVDRKRFINEEDAKPLRQKLKKIYELAPIMIRLLEAQGDRQKTPYYSRHKLLEETAAEFDPDNVNALDAERVFLLGEACTSRNRTCVSGGTWGSGPNGASVWVRPVWQDEPLERYRHRCVVNGLRKLREHIYSKEGVYQYEPVKD